MSFLPLPRQPRPRRACSIGALIGIAALIVASGCTEDPVGGASPVCKQDRDSTIAFQGPSGRCIPSTRLVSFRCEGAAPVIVMGAGTPRERRYLGGAFATRVPRLPDRAQVLGVGAGTQAVTIPGHDALYTVRGTQTQRWLEVPAPRRVLPGPPKTFLLGDSILYAGQYAIRSALPGWTVVADGSNGRSSLSGVEIASARAGQGDDVVVVELGTNDRSATSFRDHARDILGSFRHVPLVLWQTVKGPVGVVQADEINAAIRELSATRANTAVADWAGTVKDEDLSFDGVHPTVEHEDAMARLVAPMLRQWWAVVTNERVGCGA